MPSLIGRFSERIPMIAKRMLPQESRRLARFLGWFSVGLGLAEIVAPRQFTRALGMTGQESLLQLYGAREVASGVAILTTESSAAVWSRVGGDAVDIGTLAVNMPGNPTMPNVMLAVGAVAGIGVLDWKCARALDDVETSRATTAKRTRVTAHTSATRRI
jgi:hypothetical protein